MAAHPSPPYFQRATETRRPAGTRPTFLRQDGALCTREALERSSVQLRAKMPDWRPQRSSDEQPSVKPPYDPDQGDQQNCPVTWEHVLARTFAKDALTSSRKHFFFARMFLLLRVGPHWYSQGRTKKHQPTKEHANSFEINKYHLLKTTSSMTGGTGISFWLTDGTWILTPCSTQRSWLVV